MSPNESCPNCPKTERLLAAKYAQQDQLATLYLQLERDRAAVRATEELYNACLLRLVDTALIEQAEAEKDRNG